jgi:hypothetical protein
MGFIPVRHPECTRVSDYHTRTELISPVAPDIPRAIEQEWNLAAAVGLVALDKGKQATHLAGSMSAACRRAALSFCFALPCPSGPAERPIHPITLVRLPRANLQNDASITLARVQTTATPMLA